MKFKNLSKLHLSKLLKLRLKNQKFPGTITSIKSIEKTPKGFTAIVYSKEYAPEKNGMGFGRFYPDEFIYLLNIGIDFQTKEGTLNKDSVYLKSL